MAKAIRIDGVTFSGEQVIVAYTAGETPLPAASGNSFVFSNRSALTAAIAGYENGISAEQLAFFALATWIKNDPNMLTPAGARDRTAQLDLLGASAAVRVT